MNCFRVVMSHKVYVGNLTRDVEERDLRHAFEKFGDVDRIFLKDGFAFIHFTDDRDAEDAVKDMDGRCDNHRVI